jgi:hypothetical protein
MLGVDKGNSCNNKLSGDAGGHELTMADGKKGS